MRPVLEEMPAIQGVDVDEGIRRYELVCLVALAVLGLALFQQGLGLRALVPVFIGVMGLIRMTGVIPWRAGPAMLVLTLAILSSRHLLEALLTGQQHHDFWSFRPPDTLADFLLCVAVLAYVVGHFRLQGLAETPLPADPRRGKLPPGPSTRPIPEREFPAFLLTLPLWAGLALYTWSRVPDRWSDLEIAPHLWRTVVVLWALGVALVVAGGAFGYLRQRRLRPPEAALFLQDMLWHETRWEQRIIQRWTAAVRLRHKKNTKLKPSSND